MVATVIRCRVYDQLADRWIISQFATPSGASVPQDECIAISQTGDATGAWYRYGFHLTSNFLDYPKLGVWPDGYYMSANVFNTQGTLFLGPQAFVFDRVKMLAGDPTATSQTRGLQADLAKRLFYRVIWMVSFHRQSVIRTISFHFRRVAR